MPDAVDVAPASRSSLQTRAASSAGLLEARAIRDPARVRIRAELQQDANATWFVAVTALLRGRALSTAGSSSAATRIIDGSPSFSMSCDVFGVAGHELGQHPRVASPVISATFGFITFSRPRGVPRRENGGAERDRRGAVHGAVRRARTPRSLRSARAWPLLMEREAFCSGARGVIWFLSSTGTRSSAARMLSSPALVPLAADPFKCEPVTLEIPCARRTFGAHVKNLARDLPRLSESTMAILCNELLRVTARARFELYSRPSPATGRGAAWS